MKYSILLFLSFTCSALKAQILSENYFGNPVFNVSCKENDIVLFKKEEIISLHFTQSREEIAVHKFCIEKNIYNKNKQYYDGSAIICHLDTILFQGVKDSLVRAGFSPSVFYNDEINNNNDTILQVYRPNKRTSFILEKKSEKYYFTLKRLNKLSTAQLVYDSDASCKGVFMEFFKLDEDTVLVCFYSYYWGGPDVVVYKIDI